MLPLILALISSAAALPDPVTLFETINDPSLQISGARSGLGEIKDILVDQGVALAETTFDRTLEQSRCMAYELCRFGANNDVEFGPAVSAFKDFLQSMKEASARDTKNIDNLLGAVKVIQSSIAYLGTLRNNSELKG